MTSLFTAAPGHGSRFGSAVLLVAVAEFLFYGEPAGIMVFLFAILIAAVVVAMHPAAFSDGGPWLRPAAPFVVLPPLAENVSVLPVLIAHAALVVFAPSPSGRLRRRIARIAGQIALFWLAAPHPCADLLAHRRLRLDGSGGRPGLP
ncbi:hypothetical protein ACVDG5_026795 [Mesorhizobium sp. ORM6]